MADSTCPRCGHRNPLGSNFCSSCGRSLAQHLEDNTTVSLQPAVAVDEAEPEVSISDATVGDALGVLVIKRGPNAGSRIALNASLTTAGRHPDSDIFLDDITVSRRHVEIVRTEAGFDVVDVGSLNGTYVNRERIDRAVMRSGDELQIGKYKLVYLDGDGQ